MKEKKERGRPQKNTSGKAFDFTLWKRTRDITLVHCTFIDKETFT